VRRRLARDARAVLVGCTAGVVGATFCAGAAGWAGGAGCADGAGCWATAESVVATTIETTAIANFERIGRSIRLRRHAAAALNHHSSVGGLTGNCDADKFVRPSADLL
jgi:hypothetical protein